MAETSGRKTGGRALGASQKTTLEQNAAPATESAGSLEDLTAEQIEAMGPREVLMRVMRRYLREGVLPSAVKIALDLMPYHHAKKSSAPEQDDATSIGDIANDPDPDVKG